MSIVYQDGVAGKVCANPDCGWKPLSEFHQRRLRGIPVGDGFKSRCKICFNAQKRAERVAKPELYTETARRYVEVNLDHVRDLKRTHQQKYPEKYQKALEKYRNQHREKINIKARERRQQNLEHHREIGRRSRDKHVEARNAYQRAYGKRNRDKMT
jgi:hypothetical protein